MKQKNYRTKYKLLKHRLSRQGKTFARHFPQTKPDSTRAKKLANITLLTLMLLILITLMLIILITLMLIILIKSMLIILTTLLAGKYLTLG